MPHPTPTPRPPNKTPQPSKGRGPTSSHWQLYQGVGVLCVATANLFLFDVGIWSFKVQMPTDVVNQQAALSRCGEVLPTCLRASKSMF